MKKGSTKETGHADNRELTDQEFARLTAHVHTKADAARRKGSIRAIVDEVLFVLLADAGLMPKEISDLNIGDIPGHQKSRTLRIQGQPASRNRHVQVSGQTAKLINGFVRANRQGAKQSDPLVLSERGHRLGYISIYNKIRRLGNEVSLPGLNPNILRKTYMRRLFQKDQNIRLVQQQAGHASHKTTAQYLTSSVNILSGNCDACENPIPGNRGKRIDSGHVLCPQCLEAFLRKANR